MDKTFSWSGIKKEAKRVRWPKRKDVMEDSGEVLAFTAFFALYFVLCEFVVTGILKLIGIGA
ncbi:MAG: preprotein translocase subunit SecE [Solobacterium sp.]|nr:preprotein translocase subunit SecE [Solobacterium sp.]MBR3345705.1 preprotein translocase subunit SecE [Solobacterium sp.]